MTAPGRPRVVFLPGASGDREFWRPVAERLPAGWEKLLLNWPGAGNEPHDDSLQGFDDLVDRVAAQLDGPADIVAQSLGGVVAMRLAITSPERVRRLVLVATSGGLDVGGLGGADWRGAYRQIYPQAASWVTDERRDLSGLLGQVAAPTLLIWGDDDPISPTAVGERLAGVLPDATLRVMGGGTHSVGHDEPQRVAELVEAHLR